MVIPQTVNEMSLFLSNLRATLQHFLGINLGQAHSMPSTILMAQIWAEFYSAACRRNLQEEEDSLTDYEVKRELTFWPLKIRLHGGICENINHPCSASHTNPPKVLASICISLPFYLGKSLRNSAMQNLLLPWHRLQLLLHECSRS